MSDARPPQESRGEWSQNARARQELTAELLRKGYTVLPIPLGEPAPEEEPEPTISTPKGQILAPDLYCIHPKKGDLFCAAQGKGRPAWFRKYARWQHGIDYALYDGYLRAQRITGRRAVLAVQEVASPVSPHQQCELRPSSDWLYIWLDQAGIVGEHMPDWPGGARQPWRRGKNGLGGWLWPRSAMTRDPFDPSPIGDLLF